ncbi:MAG: hydroxymethylbilane synthase [Chloroflexi bacterium]|nr:hydroxymethylbilane synthase [Chloroflexota bacterium]
MREKVVVGSRGSKLALIQTASVVAKIREVNPDIEVVTSKIITKGDHDYQVQLDHPTSIGIFVKELEDALLSGQIDVAVHSLKDMPTQTPSGLCLAAVMERLDPRDVLISGGQKLAELASGSRIGTDSPRRAAQLNICRPDLEVCNIRGNVDTRLRKVADGEYAGVISAAAALKRLGWEDRITEYLPLEYFLPAAGQGALALEVRMDDGEMAEITASLNHMPTWQSITAERVFLSALGGGCRAPIAALGRVKNDDLKLEGMVADVGKGKMLRASVEGGATAMEELGEQLAQQMLIMGAERFIAEARRKS